METQERRKTEWIIRLAARQPWRSGMIAASEAGPLIKRFALSSAFLSLIAPSALAPFTLQRLSALKRRPSLKVLTRLRLFLNWFAPAHPPPL